MATLFTESTALIAPSNLGAITNVTFGDLDGDGDLDALVGNINNATPLRYFENTGSVSSPSFTEQPNGANPFSVITDLGDDLGSTVLGSPILDFSAFASLVDIDGDDDLDLFTGSVAGNVRYYENTGSATTPNFAATTGGNDTVGSNTVFGIDITEDTSNSASPTRAFSMPVFVDIDGDGDLDMFLSYYDNIDYYENTGTSTAPAFTLNAGSNPFSTVDLTVGGDDPRGNRVTVNFAQLDDDGLYDAFIVNGDGSIRYFENQGTALAPSLVENSADNPFSSSSPLSTGRSAPTFVDIDNDGDTEAFFGAEGNGQIITFFENGPETLTHSSGGEFIFGNEANGADLAIQISSNQTTQITNVSLIPENADSISLFSVLPNQLQPSAFASNSALTQRTFILENTDLLNQGQSFTLSFDLFSGGTTTTVNASQVTATETSSGSGVWTLSVDGDGNGSSELDLSISQTGDAAFDSIGTGETATTQFNGGAEIIALSDAATGSFTLYREASFNNVVGLYKIDDASGTVGGVAPGDASYAQTAIESRVTGLSLAVGNQQSTTVSGVSLDAGLYAPFIVVDSTIEDFLSGGGTAYFTYTEANADGQDHLLLLGNNLFGFEDLSGGGDFDYNDMIIQVDFA
ncbi:MAG: DUF4114 domain-containing protein [Spirulinaceae cyanobacterium]